MPLIRDEEKEKRLSEKLSEFSVQSEEREAKLLAQKLGVEYINLSIIAPKTQALELISFEQAKGAFCAPFLLKDKDVSLACKNPDLIATKAIINELKQLGFQIKIYVVSEASLNGAWNSYRLINESKKKGITGKIDIESTKLDELKERVKSIIDLKKEVESFNSPFTSQILEIILAGALALDASDVHIEAEEKVARLRYRLDGALQDITDLSVAHYHSVLSRIKLMSGMKINVHATAQDGRFTIRANNINIEIRVSIIPSAYGETIVMRVLNPKTINLKLEDLGFRVDDLAIVSEQLARPNGIILNTGPTGSGKTTTLYAFLRRIYNPEIKIITVEDPVEYHIDGITQTQVNAEKNYTFANGLRSILRQDPDVILVGEIRDNETAEIAMHSALTGHLVFSTLHTNDAAGTIPRLLDMGIQPAILGPALNLAIAQRLVRKLCPLCKKKITLNADEAKRVKEIVEKIPARAQRPDLKNEIEIYEAGVGCEKCNGTGHKGRIAILELLVVDREIQDIINGSKSPTINEIKDEAVKKGMVTLQEDALLKILAGMVSLKEAEEVVGKIF